MKFVSPRRMGGAGNYGWCETPKKHSPKILINHTLKNRRRLTTLVHEALHACCWHMSEEAVEEAADDIGSMLWNLGYKSTGDK